MGVYDHRTGQWLDVKVKRLPDCHRGEPCWDKSTEDLFREQSNAELSDILTGIVLLGGIVGFSYLVLKWQSKRNTETVEEKPLIEMPSIEPFGGLRYYA